MTTPDVALPEVLAEALAGVRSVGVITGAGVSAESGLPTYRGQGGLYDDPEAGDATIDALSGPTLRADPDRTWRTLAELARSASGAEPNAAHRAIVAIEDRVERFVLLTQNVDGLHQRAGSRNVIDIHGDIFGTVCLACERRGRLAPDLLAGLAAAPVCARCGGTLRPDVVLFGEMLPLQKVARIQRELHDDPPDLVVAAGTSALFPYIVAPLQTARAAGRLTVEINPEPTLASGHVDHALRGAGSLYFPLIERSLPGRSS